MCPALSAHLNQEENLWISNISSSNLMIQSISKLGVLYKLHQPLGITRWTQAPPWDESRLPAKSVKRWWRWYHHGTLQWPSERNTETFFNQIKGFRLWKCPWEGWNMMEYDGITGFCETFFSGHQGCHKVSAENLVSKSSRPTAFRCFRKFPANQETLLDLLDVDTLLPAETQAPAIWNWSSPDTSHWCSRLFWEQSIIRLFRATQSLSILATYPYSQYDLVFCQNLAHGNWKKYR